MTNAQHTPGPWFQCHFKMEGERMVYSGAGTIARKVDTEANARLIAAAPELLEALEQLLKLHGDSFVHKGTDKHATKLPPLPVVAKARAVITKATQA